MSKVESVSAVPTVGSALASFLNPGDPERVSGVIRKMIEGPKEDYSYAIFGGRTNLGDEISDPCDEDDNDEFIGD